MQTELEEIYSFSPDKNNPDYYHQKKTFEEYLKQYLRKSNLLDTEKVYNTRYYENKEEICCYIFELLSTPFGKAYIYRYITFQEQLVQKIENFKEICKKRDMKLLLERITRFEKDVLS